MEAAGAERSRIVFDGREVVIERRGVFACLRQSERTVTSIRDVTGIHVVPAVMGFRGFVQILIGGEGPTTWSGANQHSRCMYFDGADARAIEEVAAAIRHAIEPVAVVANSPLGPGGDLTGDDPAPPPLRIDPHDLASILVVSSNPVLDPTEPRLQTDIEEASVRDVLERTTLGRRFHLEIRPAARIDDLLRYLLEVTPTVLHLSGHGTVGGLVVTGGDRRTPMLANPMGLARLFGLTPVAADLRVVILNVCVSAEQAKFLSQWTPVVIGTLDNVPDEAAIRFADGFYTALGSDTSVRDAFDAGVAQAELTIPGSADLYMLASSIDPSSMRLLS